MAQQNLVTKKNLKAAELKVLMSEEGNNLKFMWLLMHTGIKGNEEADGVAKTDEQEVESGYHS
jgi:ribonuclease HI